MRMGCAAIADQNLASERENKIPSVHWPWVWGSEKTLRSLRVWEDPSFELHKLLKCIFWFGVRPLDFGGSNFLQARLHGRFLLRFSPFGGCEGVDYLMMLLWDFITGTFITHPLLHILQKEKIATKIAVKIARVNGPYCRQADFIWREVNMYTLHEV
jgi:hypothetical protein